MTRKTSKRFTDLYNEVVAEGRRRAVDRVKIAALYKEVENLWLTVRKTQEQIDSLELVEVVRCKDCIHLHDNDCPIAWPKTKGDFCSYGEGSAENG